jgi:hypothetical protein
MTPFVPATELKALLKGSYQDVGLKVRLAVQENAPTFGNKPVQVLGLFADHLLVLAESSNTVVKVGYGTDSEGKVCFTSHTALPTTVVTEQSVREYVRKQSKVAADLFLKGHVAQAQEVIEAIAPLVDSNSAETDEDIVSKFLEHREQPHPWKVFVNAKKDALIEGVLSDVSFPEALRPKFAALYDGATAKNELPSYGGLVRSDMGVLHKRLTTVQEQVQGALQQIKDAQPAAVAEGGSQAITALETLTTDLLNDVTQVRTFVQEAVQDFSQVDLLAKVFDSIAAEVAAFEVAGAFAVKMATRLADASR